MALKSVIIFLLRIKGEHITTQNKDSCHQHSDTTNSINIHEKYIDLSIHENFHLSFESAKYYAKCYPICPNEPKFNENTHDIQIDPIITTNNTNKSHNNAIDETANTPSIDIQHQQLSAPITDAFFEIDEIPPITFNPNPSIVAYQADYLSYDDNKYIGKKTNNNNIHHPRPKFRVPHSHNLNSFDPVNVCDDVETFCPGGTCCKMDNGHFGCCPYLSGTCCRNQLQCCPSGYECVDWPSSIRVKMQSFFGLKQSPAEVRCRINLSSWIYSRLGYQSSNNKKLS